jgi:hypothetical protein
MSGMNSREIEDLESGEGSNYSGNVSVLILTIGAVLVVLVELGDIIRYGISYMKGGHGSQKI